MGHIGVSNGLIQMANNSGVAFSLLFSIYSLARQYCNQSVKQQYVYLSAGSKKKLECVYFTNMYIYFFTFCRIFYNFSK